MNIADIVATWPECPACGALVPHLATHRCERGPRGTSPEGGALRDLRALPADLPINWCRNAGVHGPHLWRLDGNPVRSLRDVGAQACPGVEVLERARWTETNG